MGQLTRIPLSAIRENPVALRNVNRKSEEYQGLVDSIRNKGFFGAITVRPGTDDESGEDFYEIVDGLHRFTAAKDADLKEINVDIVNYDEDQVLEAQIMANIHKVETRPAQYSQQLKRILTRNPMMTESELAAKLGKSNTWIQQRLNLNKIDSEQVLGLIDEGKIPLTNAYALSKLPPELHSEYVEQAMTLPPDEFVPAVNQRRKELNEAKRKGQDASDEFQPTAHLQKTKDVKEELESSAVGQRLVSQHGLSTAQEGWDMAIKWVLHLDPDSVEAQKAKAEQRRKEAEERRKKRAAERAAEKAAKLKEEAQQAQSQAEAEAEASA